LDRFATNPLRSGQDNNNIALDFSVMLPSLNSQITGSLIKGLPLQVKNKNGKNSSPCRKGGKEK